MPAPTASQIARLARLMSFDAAYTRQFVANCRTGYVPTVKSKTAAHVLACMGCRSWNPKTSANW